MKCYKQTLIVIIICIYFLHTKQNKVVIKRFPIRTSSDNPTYGASTFTNENVLCLPSYCWKKEAKCNMRANDNNCCTCKCKDDNPTYISKLDGCWPFVNDEPEACNVVAKEFGIYVPLFTNYTTNKPDGVELTLVEDFSLNQNVMCYAQNMYYYEYYTGTKTLLYHNMCEDMIKVRKDEENQLMFAWGPRAQKEWERIGGLLLSVDIHCQSGVANDSSCFIFQVAGSSTDKIRPLQQNMTYNLTCPTKVPSLAPTFSTTVKVTESFLQEPKGMNTGVIASVVIAIILIIIIVLVLFLWKRRKAQLKMPEDDTLMMKKERLKNGARNEENYKSCVEVPGEQGYEVIDEDGH